MQNLGWKYRCKAPSGRNSYKHNKSNSLSSCASATSETVSRCDSVQLVAIDLSELVRVSPSTIRVNTCVGDGAPRVSVGARLGCESGGSHGLQNRVEASTPFLRLIPRPDLDGKSPIECDLAYTFVARPASYIGKIGKKIETTRYKRLPSPKESCNNVPPAYPLGPGAHP